MRTTNLKEGYIVRYADDFNILCRDAKTAVKWYHAVRKYLKERLKLDISPEKSQIVNLRKRESSFLGFTIRAVRKGKKRVAQTGISLAKKRQIKQEMRERIQQIHRSPTRRNALLYNSYVLGIHQYFNRATTVNLAFSRLAYELSQCLYNRLHQVGCYGTPTRPPPTYTKFYNTSCKTYRVEDVYLFPLSQIRTVNAVNYSQTTTPFTKEGREQIYKRLRPEIQREIIRLMQSNLPERSVEYMDNRISRYSMCGGKCEVTGMFLFASEVHCHHVRPVRFEGTDRFDNLRIVHKDVHRLIHATDKKTIANLMNGLGITEKMGRTINHYRQMCNMELIDAFIGERWNAVCGESRMHGVEEGKRRR
ncbi:reverse transcriptase [compost metagenome]